MIRDAVTHVVVSSVILALALIAATWIPRLTARTRHAILVAGLLALAIPAPLVARLFERNDIAPLAGLNVMTNFAPGPVLKATAQRNRLKPVATFVWAAIAAILLVRWWIVTRRLVHTAMRAAAPPPPRTVVALDAARRRLNIRHSIDLIASPTCEAPAVVRVLRPMIILPSDGCQSLDDEELESLLCHECAHVARRDNLLGVLEAVACSLFWFNPLVWLAHRRIAAAREAACDERVADVALPAETYVGALSKICRTLIAPRVPAVSCMANAHLEERIQHLMRYESLRRSAFPHGLIAAAAVLAVFIGVTAAGAMTAEKSVATGDRYALNYSLNKIASGAVVVRTQIMDTETRKPYGKSSIVTVKPGETATVRIGETRDGYELDFLVTARINADSSGRLLMEVTENGRVIQQSTSDFSTPGASMAEEWHGAPISLNLSNADIKDVIRVFAQITKIEMAMTPDVKGSVNVNVTNVPWDQAFDQIIRENGFAWRRTEDRISIFKP